MTPTLDVNVVSRTDQGGHIDTKIAGIVSVNQSAGTFVIQGPHGENFNVVTNGNTEWDGNATIGQLNTNSIVEIAEHSIPQTRHWTPMKLPSLPTRALT